MNAQPATTTSIQQKVYRQIGIWRMMPLLILALGLVFSAMFLILFFTGARFDIATRSIFLVGALIMALFGVLLFVGFNKMRLVTSPQGVILYGVGYKVYTPWDNIKAIGEGSYGGNNAYGTRFYQPSRRVEGFLFYQPARFGPTIEDGMQQHIPVIQGMALFAVQISRFANMLPLSGFLDDATRQALTDDAKTYAPQTFQTTKDWSVNHSPIFEHK